MKRLNETKIECQRERRGGRGEEEGEEGGVGGEEEEKDNGIGTNNNDKVTTMNTTESMSHATICSKEISTTAYLPTEKKEPAICTVREASDP
uniref:Uncharacterized protein n=1 Tax=Vespula pensylvanica TaxID=30213 RepID=A0A834P7M4_VESPE|nr:hypothetical protein H0235_006424 [Vespula pensylvanica]